MQHGSSQHPLEVLTLSCEDMSTEQQSRSNSLLLEGHDNRRDTAIALSWLCCDRELDQMTSGGLCQQFKETAWGEDEV